MPASSLITLEKPRLLLDAAFAAHSTQQQWQQYIDVWLQCIDVFVFREVRSAPRVTASSTNAASVSTCINLSPSCLSDDSISDNASAALDVAVGPTRVYTLSAGRCDAFKVCRIRYLLPSAGVGLLTPAVST